MSDTEIAEVLAHLKFDDQGLIPAIVQDADTGRVLTLAYMNRETVQLSLKERQTWFWSRSRQKLWHKGQASGHTQQILRAEADWGSTLERANPVQRAFFIRLKAPAVRV